jgi:hypothetical protein
MRTLQEILNTIRSILGISNSIRSTTMGIKREAQHYSASKKSSQKSTEQSQTAQ